MKGATMLRSILYRIRWHKWKTYSTRSLISSLLALLLLALAVGPGWAEGPALQDEVTAGSDMGTAFTYQGQLTVGGNPANGSYDFIFGLFDRSTPHWTENPATITRSGVAVSDGLFTVMLDFGERFDGAPRWLGVAVSPAGKAEFVTLSPRQALTPTPYAIYASQVSAHDHWGETWSGSHTGLHLTGGTTGISAAGSTWGVFGRANDIPGWGVRGSATYEGSGITYGVHGSSVSVSGRGVYGEAEGSLGRGVVGIAKAGSGSTYGVWGESWSAAGFGVYGYNMKRAQGGYAGSFVGHVQVAGNLSATGTKPFKIDHPLDPANRYLYHFAQESPEVQNVYNGVVTLDAGGEAVVALPDYFEALNTGPFRYQLTPIGAPMPNLHIAEEIQDNRFRIAGGVAGKKVSWEVTAVRNDPYVRDHPVPAEQDKPADEIGTYLYPEGYGQQENMGLHYQRHVDLLEETDEALTEPFAGGSGE